jgi:hypothetical protein
MPRRVQGFSLSDQDLEDLRVLAEARGESMSFILREALRAYVRIHLPGRRPAEGLRVWRRRKRL